uniref:Uncharacterized protein n=1 Tax=Avena sativa TaxID=4498 RepID=A0ACD5WTN5_AVESA
MSSSSSRATSRIKNSLCMEMPIFLYPRCWAGVDRRLSRTSKNTNRLFYVCSANGVKRFFLWVDVLAQTLMNELVEEHEEWLPILPQTIAAVARARAEEIEGGALIDREVATELIRMNRKIRKLEEQSQIYNYIWAFVGGMVIVLGVMLKLYEKAWIREEFLRLKLYEKWLK